MTISSNTDVQHALNVLGIAIPPLAEDGQIGPLSKAAVTAFQIAHPPLAVDGIPGPQTKAALQAALDLKAAGGNTPVPAPQSSTTDILAIHLPAVSASAGSGSVGTPPVTVHVNQTTGATTTHPLGTPVPGSKAAPMSTTVKLGIGAVAVMGAFAAYAKFFKKSR